MTFDMCIYFETIIRIKVINVSIMPLNFLLTLYNSSLQLLACLSGNH